MGPEDQAFLFVVYAIVIGLPLWFAWRLFLRVDGARLRPRRRRLVVISLSGISLSVAGFFGMLIHATFIGGLSDHWGVYRAWAQPGTLLAVLSPWLVLAAVGWSRVAGFLAGLVILFFWYLSAMAM